ncbi:hypothetical protein BFP71_09615 [Roseivirga misakiensis]|uniref:Transporter permease n=2 Tax=Roseivirga misakiensis TaxID=1563681 RepID=A0A1E5T2B6_9BACT|nr:hypothetical protein BFP71_09615 [Roseivirga misakiensis]
MFKHTLLLFFRNFKRYRSASLINLFGLSIGLASGLLIYLWVNHEISQGNFNEKDSDRHYQVLSSFVTGDGYETNTKGSTPNPLADAMNEEFPEVDYAIPVATNKFYRGTLAYGANKVDAMPQYIGSAYFNVFPLDFIAGDKSNALRNKNEIIISKKMALNLFASSQEALGKTVKFENEKGFDGTHIVSGVFEKPSHHRAEFDILFSYELFRDQEELMKWYNGGTQVHLVMTPGVDMDEFNEKIRSFLSTKTQSSLEILFAQRFADRYLYDQYADGRPVGGRIAYVRLFSLVAIFILFIACINYMNFSTAKADRRVKEIGLKKAIGAHRKNLILQHFGESILMSLLALAGALVLVFALLPKFNKVLNQEVTFELNPEIIFGFLTIALITGLISGIYPAIHLSGFKTVVALKGKLSSGFSSLWIRKGLVVFQFAISIILVVSVLVMYKQIEYIQTTDLGYDKDHIVTFPKDGKLKNDFDDFLTEVKKIPGVLKASHMRGVLPGRISYSQGYGWKGMDKSEDWRIRFYQIQGGYDLIELLGIKVIEGRTFSKDFATDKDALILNQAALDIIKYDRPIGEQFYANRRMHKIIGVVEDFHYQSLRESIAPFIFSLNDGGDNFLVKMQAGLEKETLENVQELYESFNPGHLFEFNFMDENYQAVYVSEKRINTLAKYFAIVAITISCLGLLALTSFSAQRRTKEIAIRKVLGSSGLGIIYLLSREFALLVLTSILVALPVGYYLMQNWLETFAYRISLKPVHFVLTSILMLVLAWLTVAIQTARSTSVNISESLRNEG